MFCKKLERITINSDMKSSKGVIFQGMFSFQFISKTLVFVSSDYT